MTPRSVLLRLRRGLVVPLDWIAGRAPCAEALQRDALRLAQPRLDRDLPEALERGAMRDALARREFRSVLYMRLDALGGAWVLLAAVLRRIWPGQVALEFNCEDVGPGLYISHGFATIVVAERIGRDCLISQQVTIGYSDRGGPPTLGDRVRIGAGAMVLGPIHVDDDAVVGAGAVVVSDVEAGAVVGGVPARVLPGAEDRYSALKRTQR